MKKAHTNERGTCSTALKEESQIEERSVVFFVLNSESAIWKDAGFRFAADQNIAEVIQLQEYIQ